MHFDRPTRAVLGGALRDEHIRPDVRDGDVILRVVRPLPDVAGPGRVQDGLTSQVAADPTRYRLDGIDRGDRGRGGGGGGLGDRVPVAHGDRDTEDAIEVQLSERRAGDPIRTPQVEVLVNDPQLVDAEILGGETG